jgi:hypothetical protein
MRTCCVAAAGLLAAALTAGCDSGPKTGEVTGKITVDGQVPMNGSSIRFVPTDGKSASAGDTLKDGKYTVKVAAGPCRVEIRVPELVGKNRKPEDGPASGDVVRESLPEKYHEKTELTFDVQPGTQQKDWEVSRKK